jgi:hypothetical protein
MIDLTDRNWQIVLFAILIVGMEVFHLVYSKIVKKYLQITRGASWLLLKKNHAIKIIILTKGIIGATGILVLFTIPLLRQLTTIHDNELLVLCFGATGAFIFLIVKTWRDFIAEKDMKIEKRKEGVFVNDVFFSVLPGVRTKITGQVTRWGRRLCDITLLNSSSAALKLVAGLSEAEGSECDEIVSSFLAGS